MRFLYDTIRHLLRLPSEECKEDEDKKEEG